MLSFFYKPRGEGGKGILGAEVGKRFGGRGWNENLKVHNVERIFHFSTGPRPRPRPGSRVNGFPLLNKI